MKKYDNISETAKHTSELRLDSDIRHKDQFYCSTVLETDELYRYFYSQYCEVRFKLINQIIEELKPDIVIEFASGLSSRGLILAEAHSNLIFIDTDLLEIIKFKQEVFKKHKIKHPPNLIVGEFELLTENILNFNKFLNISNKKVAFITEGPLPYFDFLGVKRVFSRLSSLANSENQFFGLVI